MRGGEGSGRRARVLGPKDPRRPWKGEERRSTRPVAAGGGLQVGRRWLRAAAPLRRGRPTAARGSPRLRLSAPAGVQVAAPRAQGPGRPRQAGLRRRLLLLGAAASRACAGLGAGAAAGAREARGPQGPWGPELGARRRTASSSCRAGPRRSPAAAGAEHKRGRRPGQQRARSGSGSGSGSCLRPLSARPQGRQPQQHYRRRPGVKRPRRRRPRTARGHQAESRGTTCAAGGAGGPKTGEARSRVRVAEEGELRGGGGGAAKEIGPGDASEDPRGLPALARNCRRRCGGREETLAAPPTFPSPPLARNTAPPDWPAPPPPLPAQKTRARTASCVTPAPASARGPGGRRALGGLRDCS